MNIRFLAATSILLLATLWSAQAEAFTVNISSGSRQLYLRVGDGVFTNANYTAGGSPGSGGPINLVSVSVPAAAVGNGIAQAMTGNASQYNSNYDGYAFCNAGQIYVGGYYRGSFFGGGTATLTVSTPANLTNAAGDTLPFNRISWTSSGNGDSGAQPVPSGTFSGGQQALATFNRNTWNESCLSFRYANTNFVAAGQYNGRATYTLSAP
ncbi:hypothetical protein [Marilutibacter chinensis]|uniref:Uncharacterized protein n=1 Tax=Marilutibacter chinensis TaxID=2912247 RepID=A0ABS9HXV2_9GAMM|nr:hypothetical protein [Lysobacter chinensis]MCF7221765.1 hypothetical protein [Lysobacter chinensis]MCF7223701.1 hypothetical protein [Lysobacter chinensis]